MLLLAGAAKLRPYLDRLLQYDNIPRKRPKFINFAKNSLNLKADREGIAEQLWEAIAPEKVGPAAEMTPEEKTPIAVAETVVTAVEEKADKADKAD